MSRTENRYDCSRDYMQRLSVMNVYNVHTCLVRGEESECERGRARDGDTRLDVCTIEYYGR